MPTENATVKAARIRAERAREALEEAERELADAVRMAPVDAAMAEGDDDLVDRLLDQMAQEDEDLADAYDHAYDVIRCNEHGEPIGWC